MILVAQTSHDPHFMHAANKQKKTMNKTLQIAESNMVDSCEAETASTISTSTVKHEVESKITVDEDGPTGSEFKDSMENRSPQEKKLAAVFAQADGRSTVSETAQNSDSKDPAKPLVTFTAQDSDKLTAYETIIGKGIDTFVEVGASLAAIRDAGLYRKYSPTFEGYVKVRWNFTKQRAYQLIQASDFRTKLVDRNAMANRLTTERATREMMKVPPDMVAEVLEVVLVDGEPTAERIIKVREKIAPKKDAKVTAKKKPAIKIKTAIKAAATWSAYLNACDVKEIPHDQRKALIKATSDVLKVLNKVNPT